MSNHRTVALLVALAFPSAPALAGVVVPNQYAAAEGIGNNSFPYRYVSGAGHYQQSFSASEFPGAMVITEIAYRYFDDNAAAAAPADFKMTLSYCATGWNTLSATFANNVGAGATVVFDGVWTIPAFAGDPGAPNPFDQRLKLTTPFTYDPALGDLLMDIEMRASTYPGGGLAGAFASSASGIGINRVYRDDGNPTSTSGTVSAYGLITEFVAGDIEPYGDGCPGAGQLVPQLSWTGAPILGGQVALSLANGLGGAPSVTLIGATAASTPIGGTCSLLVAPPFLQLFIPLSGSGPGGGAYTLPGLVPLSSPLGTIRLQAFVADPTTPVGVSASNGLAVTISA